MIQYEEIFDVDSILFFVIHPQSDPARGQAQICHNLIAYLFEKGNSPCKQDFPDDKNPKTTNRSLLPGISNITSQYGMLTIEILPPQSSTQPPHRMKTNGKEFDFKKVFKKYIKNKQHQNSQRPISIFPNDVFSSMFSYVFSIKTNDTFYVSPQQAWHDVVRREIKTFSSFLDLICETLTKN